MRLLALNLMLVLGAAASALLQSTVVAGSLCESDDSTLYNLDVCMQERLDRVDGILNEQYKLVMKSLPAKDAPKMISVQRLWLKYRDGHCESLYGGPDLGREASGEKMGCLTKITSARLSELISFRAGYIIDGFDRAVDVVRYKPVWLSYDAALKYLGSVSTVDGVWMEYAQKNCEMVSGFELQRIEVCMARMKFQVPIS